MDQRTTSWCSTFGVSSLAFNNKRTSTRGHQEGSLVPPRGSPLRPMGGQTFGDGAKPRVEILGW
jgi:hypothetical protein